MSDIDETPEYTGLEIAIIGMAGRFPGARTVKQLWDNLCAGVESITFFSDEELREVGVASATLADPNYVKASGILADSDLFDATFFGYSPREASRIDPQQRLFLECAWEALEHAGYDADQYQGAIGVYAGGGFNSYLQHNLAFSAGASSVADEYQITLGNDKDFLATRVAYKCHFTGPALTIQTACSTSLVATHVACQSLISGESDIALAGGVAVRVPQKTGYVYQPGSIIAPDGHCRAFDAEAQGTVVSSGVGVAVLKRLEDALADRDTIYAVIKGSAINNDGAAKAGYTAPGVDGQAQVIQAAQRVADVAPDTITYVETHGTGTPLGDPIEIAALTRAFRAGTQQTQFCAIGSAKTNLGHLDAAAGITGLIKTALALKHRQIPPSLHFQRPNPSIDFASSPFFVNTTLAEWQSGAAPRRAGVSAFGIGGTNAHVILEEAPAPQPSGAARPWQLLVLSAKTPAALDTMTANLSSYVQQHPDVPLADVAYTLHVGRRMFDHRRMLVCRDHEDAQAALATHDPTRVMTVAKPGGQPPVIFLFPGQGSQSIHMAADLYQSEPFFREQVDQCAALLEPALGLDIRAVIYPHAENATDDRQATSTSRAAALDQTWLTQPALFVIEYALAQLWIAWGIRPHAMIGHSIGEYVAACLSGVFSLADALALVVARGRLMQELPSGSGMLSVALSEREVSALLEPPLCLAAINAPTQCVVAGPDNALAQLEQRLAERKVQSRRLHTSHAFHSPMMDTILEPFVARVREVPLYAPSVPYISNVTGTWITDAQATDPHYWAAHLRQTVRFADGLDTLLHQHDAVLLEVGPGWTLSTFARRHLHTTTPHTVLASLRHPQEQRSDRVCLLNALGQLWLAGIVPDWAAIYAHERRQRIPLPTYPFERQRHWVEAQQYRPAQSTFGSDFAPEEFNARPSQPILARDAAGAADELEQTLRSIWQHALGITHINVTDQFFDLGGDSLMALHLLGRVRDAVQVELPLHSLLQAPTIAAQAALIRHARRTVAADTVVPADALASATLVKLHEGRSTQPLFLIHPVGGGVYTYRELAERVGGDRPVYGIQAQGFEGNAPPLTRIEDMAARYIAQLRTVQPAGPYALVGASFGGVVSFEMAQQLRSSGEQVDLLALIDTPDLDQVAGLTLDDAFILASMLGSARDETATLAHLRQLDPEAQVHYGFEHAQTAQQLPVGFEINAFRQLFALVKAHLHAMQAYHPRSYAGEIVFLRAAVRDFFNPPHPERGWIDRAGAGITIYEVPGNHTTMLVAPNITTVAHKLQPWLARYETKMV